MEQRARDVIKIGDKLFSDKSQLDSLWQEIALNFYPERADFTDKRNVGDEFSDHLFSSYPVMARRELGNMLAASLRPRSQKWFSVHINDEELDARDDVRRFLERLSAVQWRAMYDDDAGLVEACSKADHDFAAFGNAVLKFGPNINGDGLLFQNFHLRDTTWSMNAQGKVDALHRNWCPTARQLVQHFGSKCSKDVHKAMEKDPEKEFECRHVVLPTRMYNYKNEKGREFPFVSLYVEKVSETVLEEVGLNYFCYVVPRWHTVSGSQYGTSMATAIALPDGRTLQVVTRTIREAGEKYVDPPMLSFHDAIRGDYNLYAGGITTADVEYDERLGEVLRPVTQDKGGFPIGAEIAAALRQDVREAFFLDKIQLPETGTDMTAFEVRRRLEEHIRSASPIFEPMEHQYNAPLCEGVFQVLSDYRAFPFMQEMPEELLGMETEFTFRSPLADFADQRDAEIYVDGLTRILLPAAQIDPSQVENVDLTQSTRDALRAIGYKAKWFKPVDAVKQRQEEMAKAATMQKGMETLGGAAQIAETGGNAAVAINEAAAPPPA
jgi:hypothetical protein